MRKSINFHIIEAIDYILPSLIWDVRWCRQIGGKVWKGFATKSLNCFAENGPTESDWLLWYLFGSGTAQRVKPTAMPWCIGFLGHPGPFKARNQLFNYFLNFVLGFCLTYLNIIRSMFGGNFWLLILSHSLYSFLVDSGVLQILSLVNLCVLIRELRLLFSIDFRLRH